MALNGKVAVVTGGAQGLGKGFAEVLLRHGAKVSLFDVVEDSGNATKTAFDKEFGPDRTLFCVCDVTSEKQFTDAFQKTVQTFGGIDIVCNNAGIINETDWEKTVAINLSGVIRGTYLAVEHLKKQNGGRGGVIINIASMAGLGPLPTCPVYTATKHGVVGFTRAMAMASEYGGYGVRLNMICPIFVRTGLLSSLDKEERAGDFYHLRDVNQKIMERFGTLEVSDVAKAFEKLVLDESKNGAALYVKTEGADYVKFPTQEDIEEKSKQ
ncbi:15-hydroxyprostaglandin dehydrogenase [NAD(+)] [Alosa sapidissima]|uniref:15-hydroxyprostaglandin dehydrogenase [NAD(+)] n=1 Tax=Alosa sapidissima TaxID=34773 RepID=UPI001C08307B|nr:15-hydroxyprostaglandin dehydrogenase [NAD(+)] [Alosa sapidissima]